MFLDASDWLGGGTADRTDLLTVELDGQADRADQDRVGLVRVAAAEGNFLAGYQ